ncbi:zinc finger, C3HC4 type, domain containing protein [Musa troglodytarum]|nr:zinc finger, C3HC4 type, domain containing protein [Musa troglodytarum]
MFVVEQVLPLSATSSFAPYFYLDMDEYVGKRAAGEHNFPRRPSIASINQNNQGRSVHYPDRLGRGARQNTIRGALIGSQEKYKYTRAPFSSMNCEAMDASSSRSSPISGGCGRSFREQKNKELLRESTIAESSTKQDESEDSINIGKQVYVEILNSESQRRLEDSEGISVTTEHFKPSVLQNISTNITESRFTASVPKPHRQINRQFGTGKQDPSSSSFFHHSSVSHRNSSHAVKPISQRLSSGPETCSLKSLSCTSASDILPSGCSSSDFTHHWRADAVRKRPLGGDSSAARSKGANASSGGGYVVPMHTGAGLSSSSRDQSMHQPMSRTRNQPTIRDGSVSVRTHRGSTEENQMRLSVQGDDSTLLLHEPIMTPEYQWAQFSSPDTLSENASRSSPALYNLYGRPGTGNRASQSTLLSQPEDNSTRMFYGSLRDRDVYRRFNMDGFAEVLLALERIEQVEALAHEQSLMLETSLLFGGLSFHDQHRDLRMDIDNMSYEELLALEEKMGTVSTALSEEQLYKCLERSIYEPTHLTTGITFCFDENMKCSICQEEYVGEDEIGKLSCEHRYHATCIAKWLRRKNWCPICKSSVLPSQ